MAFCFRQASFTGRILRRLRLEQGAQTLQSAALDANFRSFLTQPNHESEMPAIKTISRNDQRDASDAYLVLGDSLESVRVAVPVVEDAHNHAVVVNGKRPREGGSREIDLRVFTIPKQKPVVRGLGTFLNVLGIRK